MFIDFLCVFPLLLRLGGSYVRLMSVLFSHRFLHRFLVDLGVDFGVIWGGFWEPKSVIFGIDFCTHTRTHMHVHTHTHAHAHAHAHTQARTHTHACMHMQPKSGQERPKSGPRAILNHFGIDLEPIWGAFWTPRSRNLSKGRQKAPKSFPKSSGIA